MDQLASTYYRYASIPDIFHNDIVMPNENVHRFLRRMGIRLKPLELANLVYYLDPNNYGYVTLDSIKELWSQ